MQRKKHNYPDKIKNIEWTKYFVNNIECERDDIFQTIVDRQLYLGEIEIAKKYHLKQSRKTKSVKTKSERKFASRFYQIKTHETRDKHSCNKYAAFHLEVSSFAKMFGPETEEFRLLIGKMLLVVETMFAAQEYYYKCSNDFNAATRNLLEFIHVNLSDFKAPYNDVKNELSIALTVFIFDLMTFNLFKRNKVQPELAFDMSRFKSEWEEALPNVRKSQLLDNHLSDMLNQVDKLFQIWSDSGVYADDDSRNELKYKFDGLKQRIISLQKKKSAYDASLPDVYNQSAVTKIASFFYRLNHPAVTEISVSHAKTL